MSKAAKNNKYYINNRDFTNEIIRCKYGLENPETGFKHKAGELSPKAIEYFILLANRAILKLDLPNEIDKDDFIQSALLDLLRYWSNFNEEKSNNAFAYFTQIAKNGYAKQFKQIYKHTGDGEKVEIVSLDHSGDSEIYSLN